MFYLDLFRALQEQKVRYLVVGGVAVNLHGTGRQKDEADIKALRQLLRMEPAKNAS
jgi:hypothetical protein